MPDESLCSCHTYAEIEMALALTIDAAVTFTCPKHGQVTVDSRPIPAPPALLSTRPPMSNPMRYLRCPKCGREHLPREGCGPFGPRG